MRKISSREMNKIKSNDNDTVEKTNIKISDKNRRDICERLCCDDLCEYECVLETLTETDPACCVAHRLGCICCCCCLIRRIKKRNEKNKIDPSNQLEITSGQVSHDKVYSVPVVMEQPKSQHRHTV